MSEEVKSEEDLFAEIYAGEESAKEESQAPPDESQDMNPPEEHQDHSKLLQERDAKIAELEHKYESFIGRVPNLQREIAQLKKELADNHKRVTGYAADTPRGRQSSESAKTAALAGIDPAKWERYKRDYPEEAEVLEMRFGAQQQQIEQLLQQINDVTRNQLPGLISQHVAPIHERIREESVNSLTARHPDWDSHLTFNVDGSIEHMSPEFAGFFWGISPEDRASIQWDQLRDCLAVMDAFKDYKATQEKTVMSAASVAAANEKRDRRNKALANSVPPLVKGEAPIARGDQTNMSEEDHFAFLMSRS